MTEERIPFQRNGRIPDLDDRAMGFRLLRLHGYEVSAGKFRKLSKRISEFSKLLFCINDGDLTVFALNRCFRAF